MRTLTEIHFSLLCTSTQAGVDWKPIKAIVRTGSWTGPPRGERAAQPQSCASHQPSQVNYLPLFQEWWCVRAEGYQALSLTMSQNGCEASNIPKRHSPDIEQWSQSSGSNVIPRRARPGSAGLRPHNGRLPIVPKWSSADSLHRTLSRHPPLPLSPPPAPLTTLSPHSSRPVTWPAPKP